MKSKNLRRLDATRIAIENPYGVPVTLFARDDVFLEDVAVEQLLGFVSLQATLEKLPPAFWDGGEPGVLEQVVVTPDFHKGGGIPVGTVANCRGFVVPQAVGNDVCCGMRLLVTDLRRGDVDLDKLMTPLRHVFFQGGRDIPLSPRQRTALLREGLYGLWETASDNAGSGLWKYYDPAREADALTRVHFQGTLPAQGTFAFDDYLRGAGTSDGRDAQIGSVGGGNHFVELQAVEDILDGHTAKQWGLDRDALTIMVHSGSVSLGHTVGGWFMDRARDMYPKDLQRPDHGFYVIPASQAGRYLDAMRNAANFAFGNRLFLGLMALRVLSEAVGRRIDGRLVYDAPHNLVWEEAPHFLHRKGACPALGPEPSMAGPFRYTGHPVIIPGSMGASSYVLAGAGNRAALQSACHGAGRSISRGKAVHADPELVASTFANLRVVTPIDPAQIRLRPDIQAKYEDRLKEEAPYAYKDVTPVVGTVEDAGIARRVARLWPLLTVKG